MSKPKKKAKEKRRPEKVKPKKYDSRPKKQTAVKAHTRMISAGRQIVVREHVRVSSRGQTKRFKVTCPKEAENADLFEWESVEKASHLNPLIVAMSPEDFLFLTEEWKIADYSPDFEISHGEKFDEMTETFDKQTAKRTKLVEEYADEVELADKIADEHVDTEQLSLRQRESSVAQRDWV